MSNILPAHNKSMLTAEVSIYLDLYFDQALLESDRKSLLKFQRAQIRERVKHVHSEDYPCSQKG